MPTEDDKRRGVEHTAERLMKHATESERRALGVKNSEDAHRKAAEVARNLERKRGE